MGRAAARPGFEAKFSAGKQLLLANELEETIMAYKPRRKSAQGPEHQHGSASGEEEEDSIRFRLVRWLVLALLTTQNCSLMMVTSYSRSLPGEKYLASTAVVAGELLKTVTLVSVLLYQNGLCGMQELIWTDILSRESQTAKFAIPAFFYTVQNNLWYYAMSNLDPVTAAVTSQLKVLSTALFSVLILKKKLTHVHWCALCLLVLGLSVMQLKPELGAGSAEGGSGNYLLGVLAMVAACTSSGFAGVYLERLFKELDSNIWIANMQLQCFCIPIALLTMMSDMEDFHDGNVLVGWDGITLLVVSLNALGGLVVTATMKYADNILKTFAVSMSLVLNCLLSWLFMSVSLLMQDIFGVIVVIGGTWLYNIGGMPMPTVPMGLGTPKGSQTSSDQEKGRYGRVDADSPSSDSRPRPPQMEMLEMSTPSEEQHPHLFIRTSSPEASLKPMSYGESILGLEVEV